VHPGAASLIIAQFMAEAERRRKQEDREARLRVGETHIGQLSAMVFALAALGVALYAAHVHAQWIGSIVGGGIIVSGITALRSGRRP
jgi:hypothetical protein